MSEKESESSLRAAHVIPTEPVKSILEHDRQVIVVHCWGLAGADW